MAEVVIFSGNSNLDLANNIANTLQLNLGNAPIKYFSDGEIAINILSNVSHKDVFIVQSTSPPVNNHLIELLLMADVIYQAAPKSITAVMPYFGYARHNLSAQAIAKLLIAVGIQRIITIDLHNERITKFFTIPITNIYSYSVILENINQQQQAKLIIVAPDLGAVGRAKAIAQQLSSDVVIMHKQRAKQYISKIINTSCSIQGRDCLIIDDIIDTAGTICAATQELINQGANSVYAYCTHAILSANAIARIEQSNLTKLIITNSIALSSQAANSKKIQQLTVTAILATAINSINQAAPIAI